MVLVFFAVLGSPPRMRGKDIQLDNGKRASRITPAYAGKSCVCDSLRTHAWDHPRVCGEKFSGISVRSALLGSPPRMRGKVFLLYNRVPPRRITPAYAGKSHPEKDGLQSCWDHPRVCGEKYMLVRLILNILGSPPRMRGKVFSSSAFPCA